MRYYLQSGWAFSEEPYLRELPMERWWPILLRSIRAANGQFELNDGQLNRSRSRIYSAMQCSVLVEFPCLVAVGRLVVCGHRTLCGFGEQSQDPETLRFDQLQRHF